MPPRTRQHRHDDRRVLGRVGTPEKQVIFATQYEFLERSFRNVVVDFQAAIVAISPQCDFVIQRIRDRLAEPTFRQDRCIALAFAAQIEQRIRIPSTKYILRIGVILPMGVVVAESP